LKHVRHELSTLCQSLPAHELLCNRDTGNDVGRTISTSQEQIRTGPASVAVAAARRATEAVRCLEEYSKCDKPQRAAAFEQLRYRLYEIEQELIVGGPRRRRLRDARLYVLITESASRGPWLDAARAALDGGADILQLREKSLSDRELLSRA